MKTTVFAKALGWALAASMMVGGAAKAQETKALRSGEAERIKAEVAKPAPVSMWVVSQEFTGSFANVQENSEKVKREFDRQHAAPRLQRYFENQKPAAGFASPQLVGILVLPEDPTGKSEFRMSLGFEVPGRVEVKAPLKLEEIKYDRAVHHTHVGPYEQLEAVFREMSKAGPVGFPVVLRLLSDPETIPHDWVQTELIAVVKQ